MALRRLALAFLPTALAAILTGCASGGALQPEPFPGAPRASSPASAAEGQLIGDVVATAVSLTGRPYTYGGADPSVGFDCSGLVWYSFQQHHLDVPRTTLDLYLAGREVDRSQIMPGDLVFFATTAPGPTHVGLALDGRTIVHAPSTGTSVRVERFDTPYWQSRLIGVRRLDLQPFVRAAIAQR